MTTITCDVTYQRNKVPTWTSVLLQVDGSNSNVILRVT
jgi:hypothetical protein